MNHKILFTLIFFTIIKGRAQEIKFNGSISAENNQIKNIVDPTESQDAATKAYIDALISNIQSQLNDLKSTGSVPDNYVLSMKDDFDFFDSGNWSKGLTNDNDETIRMLWNQNTGGEHLLNDNYHGYLVDDNVYVNNGLLFLENKKETIQGTDPVGQFDYTTGWINSLQKINFNGTQKGVYIEIRAQFPKGDKVWPAIWLIDDSINRGWPPEIDIWEYFGRFFNTNRTDEMFMRYIYGLWNDKKDHSVPIENFQQTYSAFNQFYTYGFLWTIDRMSWYIDDQLVHTKTKGVEVPSADWPDKPMCLVINNGLMRVVGDENTTFPNALVLDYIKIYEDNN